MPVEIDVGVYGVTTAGKTVNLSNKGMLANVDQPIEVGERCMIRFSEPGPNHDAVMSGTVVRVHRVGDGNLVALEFD